MIFDGPGTAGDTIRRFFALHDGGFGQFRVAVYAAAFAHTQHGADSGHARACKARHARSEHLLVSKYLLASFALGRSARHRIEQVKAGAAGLRYTGGIEMHFAACQIGKYRHGSARQVRPVRHCGFEQLRQIVS